MDSDSFTGSPRAIVVGWDNLIFDRRRIHYLLPNGARRAIIIPMSDDNEEMRAKIGEMLVAERHGFIRGGKIVEG